jgi:hypothetical protein
VWENSCGKPAADEYCREMGYTQASSFDQAPRVGSPGNPTAIIGESGVFCPGNSPGHRCDGFSYIECK